MQEAWDILKQNPILYVPPFLMLFIRILAGPESASISMSFFISLSALFFINVAIGAGWTQQIKVILTSKEKKVSFDDFLQGIGKYFGVVSSGSIVLLLLFGITFVMLLNYLESSITITPKNLEEIKEFAKVIKELDEIKITSQVDKISPEVQNIFSTYIIALASYIGIASTLYFFIGLWSQIAVFKGLSWSQSWKDSFLMIKKNFWSYTFLSLVQLWFTFIIFTSSFYFREPFLGLLNIIFSIIVDTYFNLLFCLFIFKFSDNNKIDIINNELQPPLPKV